MADSLLITLPKSQAASVEEVLAMVPEVESTHASQTRFDPASVLLFVKLASSVLGVTATAVPIILKLVEALRGKGVAGATIEFPGGGKLSVDNASVGEIERLIRAARA